MEVATHFQSLPYIGQDMADQGEATKEDDHHVFIYVNEETLNDSDQDSMVRIVNGNIVDGKNGRSGQKRKRKKTVRLNLLEGTLLAKINRNSASGKGGGDSPQKPQGTQSDNTKDEAEEDKPVSDAKCPPVDYINRPKLSKQAWATSRDTGDVDSKGRFSPKPPSIVELPNITPSGAMGHFASSQDKNNIGQDNPKSPREGTKVDVALDAVMKIRQKKRDDILAGVPTEFAFGQQAVKVIHDKMYRRKPKGNKPQGNTSVMSGSYATMTPSADSRCESTITATESEDRSSNGSKKGPRKPNIPGWYVFPKAKDFIPQNRSNRIVEGGFDWLLQEPRKNQKTIPPMTRPKPSSRQGKLCRSFYPVTEALHKEGTSVSKLKGTVPEKLDVTKVWPRKLDADGLNQMIPSHAAKKDVRPAESSIRDKNESNEHLSKHLSKL